MKRLIAVSMSLAMLALSCSKPAKTEKTSSQFVAKVNSFVITAEDIKNEISLLPPQLQDIYNSPDGMQSLVDEIVKKEILYQEAAKRNYQSKKEFKDQMEEFKKRLSIEHLLKDEIEAKTSVSENDIKEFYDANKDKLKRGEGEAIVELDSIKDLIKERLVAEKQKGLFESYIEGLKKTAKVEINDTALKAMIGNTASSK